ncbi:cytochrome P450 CYP82D47-like protein [Tanacetum coccineum]
MTRMDMKELFGNLIIDIIGRIISGKQISPNDDEAVRVAKWDFCGVGFFLEFGGHEKVTKVSAKNLDNILERWSNEHKKRRDTRLKGESKPDLMYTVTAIESSKQQLEATLGSAAVVIPCDKFGNLDILGA